MNTHSQDWFKVHCLSREVELRKSSERVYRAWWHRYCTFLSEKNKQLDRATTLDVAEFLNLYSGNTAIRYFRLLHSVYETAVAHELCTANPLSALASTYEREEEPVPAPVAPQLALDALYSLETGTAWKRVRDRAMVLLAAEGGLRRQELIELTIKDLRLDGAAPRVVLRTPSKRRDIELGGPLCAELAEWLKRRQLENIAGDLAFAASSKGNKLDPSTVYRIIAKHLNEVGAGKEQLGATGTQVLRASAANRAKVQGRAVPAVQAMLGHQQLMSTISLLERIESPSART